MKQKPNAIELDLNQWRKFIDRLDLETLFVTVSGAHIYGFPSVDSDVDLRGCHRLPLRSILGLSQPIQTYDRSEILNGIEVDIVSHEIGKYFGLLVKNNGYILEQVFSPIVVSGQSFLDELRPLAKKCITRNHYYHYRGFFANQKKLIAKQQPVTAKAVLYAYRVLCTGIHLLNSGEIQTDLNLLADEQKLTFVPKLIAAKIEEHGEFKFDVDEHLHQLEKLEQQLEFAHSNSKLRYFPEREPINDFLVGLRLPRKD